MSILEQLKYQLEYTDRKIEEQKEVLRLLEEKQQHYKDLIEGVLKQR
jgi:hypothetical protein